MRENHGVFVTKRTFTMSRNLHRSDMNLSSLISKIRLQKYRRPL
jgi:hypothetical protein